MSQQSARIVREVHHEAHIKGSRVTVHFIKERVEGRGPDPETVANGHNLDVADAYRAMAYYHDHPEEMRKVEAKRRERNEKLRDDPNVATGPEDVSE